MAELMVSVSGIRGIVGDTMTAEVAARFAAAFGTLVGPGRIVLGRDSRTSGRAIAAAVSSGLLFTGCEVIDLGIATTPGVTVMVDELEADGGVMITASHNPMPWNGIKFFRADGIDLAAAQGARLKDIWQSGIFKYVGSDGFRQLKHDDTVHSRHMARVLATTNRGLIARRRPKVVLDACHGAGAIVTPQLLSELGCVTTVIGGQPDGLFEHPPEPIAENLTKTCDTVRAVGADIGLVQDPDADRLALIDERGRFISEEYTLALAAMHRLQQQAGPVAANLSTSRMIDDVAARHGQVCHRTPVGEVHVADKMVAEGCVIGGEGNGGVIDPRVSPIRDSLAGIGLILELLASRGKPLSAIAAELPAYTMIKRKREAPRPAIQKLLEVLPEEFAEARIDTQDGVRMDWPEGWVHVRASNTEPIFRMIGESADAGWVEAMLEKVAGLATRLVK
ncbi:MAG TPA: phosphoglucosamine mutase [Phycisphaerae bacterium]|nr:phosphoglucosamine mutase [Phycisphaerae bacterium]HOI55395.1 phosphoglucosamine mutase [Phycisphaerae bacterium]